MTVEDQQEEAGSTVLIYYKYIHSGLYTQGLLTSGRSLCMMVSVQGCTLAAGEGAPHYTNKQSMAGRPPHDTL
jgi:hypothetical protein